MFRKLIKKIVRKCHYADHNYANKSSEGEYISEMNNKIRRSPAITNQIQEIILAHLAAPSKRLLPKSVISRFLSILGSRFSMSLCLRMSGFQLSKIKYRRNFLYSSYIFLHFFRIGCSTDYILSPNSIKYALIKSSISPSITAFTLDVW